MELASYKNGDDVSMQKSEPTLIQPETKSHAGFYFLSNLDQLIASTVKTVYLYKPDDRRPGENFGDTIKHSLARILVHYYPLAGKLRVGSNRMLIVECTNEGVPFVEAKADCNIDVVDIRVADSAMLRKLVYTSPGAESILEMPLMTVQVTRFKCGGFALGLAICHCMADGISAMEFINSWAETARGIPLTIQPVLDRSILRSKQPPKTNLRFFDLYSTEISDVSNIATLYQEEQILFKYFLFDSDKLARLKDMAMEDGAIKSCTSFTVLAAFVWHVRSKALKMKPDQKTRLLFPVDVRAKLNPPLPKGYFGNGIVVTGCLCTARELIEKPLSFAVEQVQNAIQIVNEDFIKSWIDYFEVTKARPSSVASFGISSWTRLSLDNADFGWGELTHFGYITVNKDLGIFQSDGKEKKGIKVGLGLPVSAMNTFQELVQV